MPEILVQNSWPCKLIAAFAHFAETLSFFYLILMASSLRLLIVGEFKSISKTVVSLGVIVSIFTTVAWAVVMKFTLNFHCWSLDTEYPQHWINDGQRLAMFSLAAFYFVKALLHKNESCKIPEYVHEAK